MHEPEQDPEGHPVARNFIPHYYRRVITRGKTVVPSARLGRTVYIYHISLMSTGASDYAQFDTVILPQSHHRSHTSAEASPLPNLQMSGIAHPRSSPGPVAGGTSGQLTSNTNVEGQKSGNQSKALQHRSVDYILRSGLAGGLAGCAVSSRRLRPFSKASGG